MNGALGSGRFPFLKPSSRVLDVSTDRRNGPKPFFSLSLFFFALTARICLGEDNHLSGPLCTTLKAGDLVVTETQYGTTSRFETKKKKKLSGVALCANSIPGMGLKRCTMVRWRFADFYQGRSKWKIYIKYQRAVGVLVEPKNCFFISTFEFVIGPPFSPRLIVCAKI